jgi:NAD+ synthase
LTSQSAQGSEAVNAYLRQLIVEELGVARSFDPAVESERRVDFLADQILAAGAEGLVLGISGGVDSTTAGRLCQLAAERVRESGQPSVFVAVRLPYRVQNDEVDAASALKFIRADEVVTVDIQPGTDAVQASIVASGLQHPDDASADFTLGNIKARQRMVIQYAIAGSRNLLVVGTDHAAEAAMGFFTKHGDGACDLVPLSGLTKRRVRAVGSALGVPVELINKVPTADLESLRSGLPDEEVFGITYDDIDDFLEGVPVSDAVFQTVVAWHRRTRHKRALPVTVP